MRSGKIAGEAASVESLAASDLIAELAGLGPVNLAVLGRYDRSDNRVGAVRRLDTTGSQVGFTFEFLAAFAVVQFPATGELGGELFVVGNDDLPAFDELADR